MNDSFLQHDFSGNSLNNSINPTLVTMQIQALRESLRRLEDRDEAPRIELPGNEPDDIQPKANC